MCAPLKRLWAKVTFPHYFYYPEDHRGSFAAQTCGGEAAVWLIALSPAVIMATFLWGYTSVLSAMLCFHFISCLLLPLVYVAAAACRRQPAAAVCRFLRRKLCLRNSVVFVPAPAAAAQRCCARAVFEAVPQTDRVSGDGASGSASAVGSDHDGGAVVTVGEETSRAVAVPAAVVTVGEESSRAVAVPAGDRADVATAVGVAEGRAGVAAAPLLPGNKVARNGLLLCVAAGAWVAEACFGMLLAWVFSLVDLLWEDIMEVIVDTVNSRYAVNTGGQAIFIGIWFSFVNPLLEELFWRGFLGERAPPRHRLKALLCAATYASYHLLVTVALAPTAFSNLNVWLGFIVFFAMLANGVMLDFLYSKYGFWFAAIVHSGQDAIVMVVFLNAFFTFLPQLAPAAAAAAAASQATTP